MPTSTRILVTGARGLLGSEVVRVARTRGFEVTALGRAEMDVTDRTAVHERIRAWAEVESEVRAGEAALRRPGARAGWIVHCAAYAAVDRAEDEPELAERVNVDGTRHVAEAAADAGARLLYVSTDYVFDGGGREPIRTNHVPRPLGVYGKTKWAGECVVLGDGATDGTDSASLVVRTGWLYGRDRGGFVHGILGRARRGEPLRVVSDQTGRPTFAGHAAATMLDLMELASRQEISGIWHVADGGRATWLDVAREALRITGIDADLRAAKSEELGAPAPRPAFSVLDVSESERALGRRFPDWRIVLAGVLASRDAPDGGPEERASPAVVAGGEDGP